MHLDFEEIDDNVTIVRVSMELPIFPYDAIRMNTLEVHPLLLSYYLVFRYDFQDNGISTFLEDWDHYFLGRVNWSSWSEYVERVTDQEMPEQA